MELLLVSALAAPAIPDTVLRPGLAPDTLPPPTRVVRTLEVFTVRGTMLRDPLSTATARAIPAVALRSYPVDGLVPLLALQAGIVAQGEDLHVRGGRAGEFETLLEGIRLNEPLRGRPFEVPLLALREAEVATGGLDADKGGALAGVLSLRTVDPGPRREVAAQWQTDTRRGTHYDRVSARAGGPLGVAGLGAVATVEATLDDTHLPALRSNGRRRLLGGSFGWRADNRLLGHAKIVSSGASTRISLETLLGRMVHEPYSPMWSLDGWTVPCIDRDTCFRGPGYSSTPAPGFTRYRAADHSVMTDERRIATVLAWQRLSRSRTLRFALGWSRVASITSLDGHDDESYVTPERVPFFGYDDSPTSDPLYVYWGDEPYFKKTLSDQYVLRGDWDSATPRGSFLKTGAGLLYDAVELREMDGSAFTARADSVRAYRAWAPGGYAYTHGRWAFEGMAANAGLRLECFTAGPQAESQSLGQPARTFWTFSPRLGIAYPLSLRDVVSFSYVRIRQAPSRDYLYDNRIDVTNRQPIGNPALEPATLISYQGAIKHLLGARWSLQASLFYRDLFGLVGARNTRPQLDIPRLVYRNADDAHALGGELSAYRVEGERSRIELHYTWLEARGTSSSEEGVPFGPRLRSRPESIGQHDLDWDRRHSLSLSLLRQSGDWSAAWTTAVGSALPWTPRPRRELEADLSLENTRRLGWEETSALSLRCNVPFTARRVTAGLDVRNVFDRRNPIAATVDGYPHPYINTVYDDYSAYRNQTGRSGGAFWDDTDGDGSPGWVPVNDPRLFGAPRTVRLFLAAGW
jgi:outer membrane receptor protein involved in Fe transport